MGNAARLGLKRLHHLLKIHRDCVVEMGNAARLGLKLPRQRHAVRPK